MSLSKLGQTPTLEELAAMVGPAPSNSPTPSWERALVSLGQSLGGHINSTPFMQVADSGDWAGAGKTAADILMRDVLGRDPETGEQGLPGVGLAGMTVFHGSPHKWMPEPGFPQGRPRLDKIGTGEGAQVYGHGIYFAENPGVARAYADNVKDDAEIARVNEELALLAKIMAKDEAGGYRKFKSDVGRNAALQYDDLMDQRSSIWSRPGALYSLDLPDEAVPGLLDWDAPLKSQTGPAKILAGKAGLPLENPAASLYHEYAGNLGNHSEALDTLFQLAAEGEFSVGSPGMELAAHYLRSQGIPGLKYYDAMSRNPGEGTRNFVIWDQDWLDRMPILGVE